MTAKRRPGVSVEVDDRGRPKVGKRATVLEPMALERRCPGCHGETLVRELRDVVITGYSMSSDGTMGASGVARSWVDYCTAEGCRWVDPVSVHRSAPLDELRRRQQHRFVVEQKSGN